MPDARETRTVFGIRQSPNTAPGAWALSVMRLETGER
jgi:hypothetical protein